MKVTFVYADVACNGGAAVSVDVTVVTVLRKFVQFFFDIAACLSEWAAIWRKRHLKKVYI